MDTTNRSRPSFLGAVMKEIACTPNTNFDPDDYQRRVVEPVRRIRRMDEQLGGDELPASRRGDVIEILAYVLEAKGVDPAEREERLAGLAHRFSLAEAPAVVPVAGSSRPGARVAEPLAQAVAV